VNRDLLNLTIGLIIGQTSIILAFKIGVIVAKLSGGL
jgi:hypothetical protein